MKFLEISIQGFKSFAKKKTFVFPEGPGLFFLTGLNEVEPDLEANAAGKTTTWDAVCWCLYGKTPRNKTAGDIKNWYSNEKVVVSLKFSLNNIIYTLTRTWNPNSLELREHGVDGKGDLGRFVTQEELVGIIKLDFDQFLYSILFSQFRGQFFDLGQAAKTELFTQILNLEEWDEYSKRASQKVSLLEGNLNDLKMDVSNLSGKIETLESLDFDEKIENWEKRHSEEGEERLYEIQTLKKELEDIRNESKKAVIEQDLLKSDCESMVESLKDPEEELKEIEKEQKIVTSNLIEIKSNIKSVNMTLEKFDKLSEKSICPTCEQEVDPEHVKKELKKLKKQLSGYEASHEEECDVKKELESLKADALLRYDTLNKEYNKAVNKLKEAEYKVSSLKKDASKVMLSINRKEDLYQDFLKENNPYLLQKAENAEKIKQLNMYLMQKSNEQLTCSGMIEQVAYWVKAFKNIRLFLISEVLTQLEVEVNNCLFRLGLREWKIEFDIDKENKSGTVKKGFTILIYSPYNTEPVSWESWSGGETQRLKLAGTIGLSNLILARCGIDSYVETYDEPSNWLSQKGIDQLLETLDSRSQELNKQIWLIDHRSLDSGYFTGMYSVNKNKEGSYFSTL